MTTNDPAEQPAEYDWGGDGSDLHQPVAEHVRAALLPSDGSYPPPIDTLLSLGSPHDQADLQATLANVELDESHVPDLVRLARDRDLNTSMADTPEIWGPIYAVLALARLDAGDYAAELVPLFDVDNEWFGEELPDILGKAGAPALAALRQYVQDSSRWQYGRWNAASALAKVGQQHPELRDQAIESLSGALADERNDPEINGFLLSSLLTLKATEALPAIRTAFERDAIDESIAGSWGEVLEALEQPIDTADPLFQRSQARRQAVIDANRALLPALGGERASSFPKATATKSSKPNNRKSKRKAAAASRKANKKKRR